MKIKIKIKKHIILFLALLSLVCFRLTVTRQNTYENLALKSFFLGKPAAGIDFTKPRESFINPQDISSGKKLALEIRAVLAQDQPQAADYEKYARLLWTGLSIFKAYSAYDTSTGTVNFLNENGRKIKAVYERKIKALQQGSLPWEDDFADFKNILSYMPTVEFPNEELFIDAFENMTTEQINACAYKVQEPSFKDIRFLDIQLTSGTCGNNCDTCGLYRQGKAGGKMRHMPYPVAVKIMKRYIAAELSRKRTLEDPFPLRTVLEPFFISDPLYYHDSVVNADLSDIDREAMSQGFLHLGLISHGHRGKSPEEVEALLRRIKSPLTVSFHMSHHDARTFLLDKIAFLEKVEAGQIEGRQISIEAEKLIARKERLIKRYKEQFTPLVKVLLAGGVGEIRKYAYLGDEYEYLEMVAKGNEKVERACRFLDEMQSLQDELWQEVIAGLNLTEAEILERSLVYIADLPVIWVGNAALFLKNVLGVPERYITEMQEANPRGITGVYPTFLLETDGEITLVANEMTLYRVKTVAERFDNSKSANFKTFAQFLKLVLKMYNQNQREGKVTKLNGNSLAPEIVNHIKAYAPGFLQMGVPDFFISTDMLDYYFKLFNFYLTSAEKTDMEKLLKKLSPRNLARLFTILEDIPFLDSLGHLEVELGWSTVELPCATPSDYFRRRDIESGERYFPVRRHRVFSGNKRSADNLKQLILLLNRAA